MSEKYYIYGDDPKEEIKWYLDQYRSSKKNGNERTSRFYKREIAELIIRYIDEIDKDFIDEISNNEN